MNEWVLRLDLLLLCFASSSLKVNYFHNVSIVNVILDSKYKILVAVLGEIKIEVMDFPSQVNYLLHGN